MKLIGRNPTGFIVLITNAELQTISQKAFDNDYPGYHNAVDYFASDIYIDKITTVLATPALLEKVNNLSEIIGRSNKELDKAVKILLNKVPTKEG